MLKLIYKCRNCGRRFVLDYGVPSFKDLVAQYPIADLDNVTTHKCALKGRYGIADLVGIQE